MIELALVGLLTGVLGCWVVFYELSYSAESLAHALFPGLVVAALLDSRWCSAPRSAWPGQHSPLRSSRPPQARPGHLRRGRRHDAVRARRAARALAVVAPRSAEPPLRDPLQSLPGDLLKPRCWRVVLAALAALHRRLLAVGFDRGSARALWLRPVAVELALIALVAVAILVSVQALGNLLVVAILIAPAATARLLTRRLPTMMAIAAVAAIACSVVGLYLSYYAGLAAGASIALALVGAYLLTFALTRLASHKPSDGSPRAKPDPGSDPGHAAVVVATEQPR